MNQVFKTTILLGFLTGLFVVIGYSIAGRQGMYIALAFAAIMNLGSYWFSDKMVLSSQGARALDEAAYPQVVQAVRELVAVDGLPMPKLYVVDTPVPNAFATGRSPEQAAVAVTTGIVKLVSVDELKAVIAHELGHVKNRDILLSSIAATLAGAITLLAQVVRFGGALTSRDERSDANPLALLVTLLLAPLAATLIQLAISRSREYAADEHGARLMGTGHVLASALQKLEVFKQGHDIAASPASQVTAHLMFMNMINIGMFAGLFSTHPATRDRIARLERL